VAPATRLHGASLLNRKDIEDKAVLLKDKCGLITGAASGMGRAAASLFASHGARVMCADLDLDGARKTAEAASIVEAHACGLDVSDKAQCQQAVKQTVDRFGRVDFLAHFAGIWDGRNTADIEEEHWDRIIDVNLKGSFLIAQAVEPVMVKQKYGRIVLIGSLTARVGGNVGGPHYAASKGGVAALGRALARRMGAHDITVNIINPGPVESKMTDGWPDETKRMLLAGIPLRRLGKPIDIAGPALFLLSDLSGWMTGETLEVNGGLYFG
jgi:NAD(P)-dependent dehydrogenase (short-subunit alcohol dehydrogenase family)